MSATCRANHQIASTPQRHCRVLDLDLLAARSQLPPLHTMLRPVARVQHPRPTQQRRAGAVRPLRGAADPGDGPSTSSPSPAPTPSGGAKKVKGGSVRHAGGCEHSRSDAHAALHLHFRRCRQPWVRQGAAGVGDAGGEAGSWSGLTPPRSAAESIMRMQLAATLPPPSCWAAATHAHAPSVRLAHR